MKQLSSCFCCPLKRDDIGRLRACVKGHFLRHCLRMLLPQMPVAGGDQDAPVKVSEPFRNHLEVNPRFDCVAGEKVPHAVMAEMRQLGLLAPLLD